MDGGRRVGFEDFYASTQRAVFAQVYGSVGDVAEAQDITVETFTRAWVHWRKISTYDDPLAWSAWWRGDCAPAGGSGS